MDIYERKSKLKLILIAIAGLIAVSTLLYTRILTRKIAEEEKNQVRLWAEAISNKARLVKYTNELFAKLAADERKKVNLYARATTLVLKVEDSEALNFATDIITGNENIPTILVDVDKNILDRRNVEFEGIEDSTLLTGVLGKEFGAYPPIPVRYEQNVNYIYYTDSKLFTELKKVLNDLIRSFIAEVINSASVPVILTDQDQRIIEFGNIDSLTIRDSISAQALIASMANQNERIEVDLGDDEVKYVYYENSYLLTQLTYYPWILLTIIGVFLFISYLAFSSARKAEQNQVWVGMAKETAHQLGTPISSLSAWVEYIKETPLEQQEKENVLNELDKDINRLALVADRFSKIGSKSDLKPESIHEVLNQALDYIKARASKKVSFELQLPGEELNININRQLFDWVIENVLKNALDAMDGEGEITVAVEQLKDKVAIDITDTGKGIPKSRFDTVFQPGFSTKQRGWGLGLSLTKRIVENYHYGKIFVKNSTIGDGTTFRILLPV